MSDVKAKRRGITGTQPDVLSRHALHEAIDVLANLQQGMDDGHEQRRIAFDATTQPDLGQFFCHG